MAAAIFLMAAGLVLGTWLWSDSFSRRAKVRHWVEQACNRPGKFNDADVRAIGPDAVPYLIEMLHVEDTPARRLSVKIGKKLPAWLRQYWPDLTATSQLHTRTVGMLRELGPASKPALPDLIAIVQNNVPRSPFPAMDAIKAIAAIGPEAAEALPALHSAWTNGGVDRHYVSLFNYYVAEAIWKVGRETNAVLKYCQSALTNDAMLMFGLAGQLDEASRKTLAAILVDRLQDSAHPKTHCDDAIGLHVLNVPDEPAQRALLQGARDSVPVVRMQCASGLWAFWPSNAVCVSVGTRIFLEWFARLKPGDSWFDSDYVRDAKKKGTDPCAAVFLETAKNHGVDPTATIPALEECLHDDDPKIRAQAAKALAWIREHQIFREGRAPASP